MSRAAHKTKRRSRKTVTFRGALYTDAESALTGRPVRRARVRAGRAQWAGHTGAEYTASMGS